ncbi:MAG: NAD+ synthase [Halanaerobiaceae bacterium]
MEELDYNHVIEVLVNWLREKIAGAGGRGAVVGLSGGIDSAVTALLCREACNNDVLGVILPCYSSTEDEKDARRLAEKAGIEVIVHDLAPVYDDLLVLLQKKRMKNQLAAANIKPRLRMIVLYYYAAVNDYLVVGTDNWSELKTGYFTKHGDGGVDLAPLGRLVKTEVRELARQLGVPEEIIEKKPSAGLWEGQTDEEELGISYRELDRYILTGEASSRVKKRVEALSRRNNHKLEPPPVPDREMLVNRE